MASASINEIATGTSHNVTISQPGIHTIQVQPISQHLPTGDAVSVEVTVRGEKREEGVVKKRVLGMPGDE